MTPQLKLILCLFATYAVELVVTNAVNPPEALELTPAPATPGPANPTEQPKPTTPTPATPAPVNPTEQPKPTTPAPARSGPVVPTEQPNPTKPGSINPTQQTNPTTPGSINPTQQTNPTTPGSVNPTLQPNSTTPEQNNSTTNPQPTIVPDICERLPCPSGSQCEPRANNTRVCLCLAGDYFNEDSQRCETAKVFPGQLKMPILLFTDDMRDKTSETFQFAAGIISDEIGLLFTKESGYLQSILLELKKIEPPKVRAVLGVIASVEMVFQTSSQIKVQDIEKAVTDGSTCGGCLLRNSSFAKTKLCDKKPCDEKTTTCSEKDDGDFLCSCSEDYVTAEYHTTPQRACVACPSGQKPNGTRECVDCPFGYSGFNCNESWKLALVIVGSVLGGLLLITIIVLIVVSTKAPKISKKTKKDLETTSPDVIHFTDKEPLVTSLPTNQQGPLGKPTPVPGVKPFPSGAVPRIPRATAVSHWDNGINLEMTPSNSRPSSAAHDRGSWLNDNPEDVNGGPYSRPRNQTNPYAQRRPLNNPYSESQSVNNPYVQDRPRTNPYARNQGQSNPIYSHDDERPFNY